MVMQFLKAASLLALANWLKPRYRALLMTAAGILVTRLAHGEYVDYVMLTGNDSFLVQSILIKWLLYLLFPLLYLLLCERRLQRRKRLDRKISGDRKPSPDLIHDKRDDGFDFLRQKKRLRRRAEIELENPRR